LGLGQIAVADHEPFPDVKGKGSRDGLLQLGKAGAVIEVGCRHRRMGVAHQASGDSQRRLFLGFAGACGHYRDKGGQQAGGDQSEGFGHGMILAAALLLREQYRYPARFGIGWPQVKFRAGQNSPPRVAPEA
jgi:hypothetical protein